LAEALRRDLLDALAADLTAERKLLPCGVLRRLIEGAPLPRVAPEQRERALLLAAVYRGLVNSFSSDFPEQVLREPPPMRWRRDRHSAPQIPAFRLELATFKVEGPVRVPLATYKFLSALPADFVARLVSWAPPVVGRIEVEDAPVSVLENVLSGFLAAQVLPHRQVTVRTLIAKSESRFGVADLAQFAQGALAPLFEAHRDRIVCAAPNYEVAQTLTGLGRAMVARIRQKGSA
jgi:hypothetical protein